MAKFVKGNPGNLKGRGKGTINATTRAARAILNEILYDQIGKVRAALDEVYEADKQKYLDILTKLLPFYIPRRTDITSDDEPINAGFLGMTKEEIEAELAQWKKR